MDFDCEPGLLPSSDKEMFSVESDLIAIRPPPDTDPLSRLLRNHWPFPSEVGRHQSRPLVLISLIESRSAYHRTSGISSGTSKTAVFLGW
jgi:hypothetical protein